MKVPGAYLVGAATHTGSVRVNNEDDYLLGSLVAPEPELLLCAVADGMGGAAGGAEASRAALRALGAAVLDGASVQSADERLQAGFSAAAARVFEHTVLVPSLRDMGTTLTAVCFEPRRASVGHIGDTRLCRLRDGAWEVLTTDHAVRHPDNLLTRCIGGGQPDCVADRFGFDTRPGDRFVLLTDGVWSAVVDAELPRLVGRGEPQAVAEALVRAALAAGGPDNATAVVVEVRAVAAEAPPNEIDVPREERPDRGLGWSPAVSLRSPWWPWLLLAIAAVLTTLVVLRLGFDFDGWVWLRSHW